MDCGAPITLISPRMVDALKIPYRIKDKPVPMGSFEGISMAYGKGMMRLETETVTLQVSDIINQQRIGIVDLGPDEMLIGYDWLEANNPTIDWRAREIRDQSERRGFAKRDPATANWLKPARTVQGVRHHRLSPEIQCTTRNGRIGKISPHKIRRIYEKNPRKVGVIWIRKVDTKKGGPPITTLEVSPDKVGPWTTIPDEYNTEEFQELFEENEATELANHQEWDHEIHLEEGARLRPGPIYPLSADQQEELRTYIAKNLKRGFIRESESSMASPILFVPKKNGKLRLCVDYRQLNNATRKNRYPLPLIQELMDRLQGVKWITKFDIREGYYRIRIAKGFEWLTAFKTRYGLYEYTVMPFGLTNAPATFQAVINRALHEYLDIFVIAYLDDVLVYSSGTLEEHVEHVKKVLRKLKEYRLYLQPEKCEFHVKETEFLGFIISDKGVSMDPKKVSTVQDWPLPKTVKDVQSFLGFANFYRKFIRNYSKTTTPLTEVTKKEKGFSWGTKQQEAFDTLKQLFLEAPMLQMYDPVRATRVETDASDYALGAILSQQCDDGKWRPVFYHSRKFSGAELNYDVHDKELLAVISAFEQWEAQLIGARQQVEVFSDHQNLTSFTTTKKLNRRQVRWAELLAIFDFKIYHRPGSLNGAADALSRRSDLKETDRPEYHDAVLRKEPDGSLQYNQPEIARVRRVGQALTSLQEQWRRKAAQWTLDPDSAEHQQLSTNTREHKDMVTASSLRPYVPPDMRRTLIKELHESPGFGHPGIEEMVRRLARTFAIPSLRKAVEEVVGNCVACHQNKPKRHKPYGLLQPLTPPTRPWTNVTMDFIVKLPASLDPATGHVYDSILVIVDRLTKESKFIPTNETLTAEGLLYLFNRHVVSDHGMPEEVITDRGVLFTSTYWKTYLAKQGTKGKLSTSFHPETDGQTERINQIVEQYLRFYANKLQSNWVELLPTAQLAYNSATSSTTKVSPHYANRGYEPVAHRDPYDIESLSAGAEDKARKLQELHQELSDRIAQRNLTTSKQANKKRIEGPTLKRGDRVFLSMENLKTKRPSKKLDNLRKGPFKITKVKGPVTFELKLPKGVRINPRFHKKHLELAPPDAPLCTSLELENEEYEVEEIKDLQKFGRQWKYLVKWQGWPESQNTWEPERNLTNCKSLVQGYHERTRQKERSAPKGRGRPQRKDQKIQPVTSPGQRTIIRMVSTRVDRWQPYYLPTPRSKRSPSTRHDPEQQEWRDRDPRRSVPTPRSQEVPPCSEPTAPLGEQPQDASGVFQPEPSPIFPREQTGYIRRGPQCTQHSSQWQCPQNNEDSPSHNVHNEKSFHNPTLSPGDHGGGGCVQTPSRVQKEWGREAQWIDDWVVEPWAWLGRLYEGWRQTEVRQPYNNTEARDAARTRHTPRSRDENLTEGDSVTGQQRPGRHRHGCNDQDGQNDRNNQNGWSNQNDQNGQEGQNPQVGGRSLRSRDLLPPRLEGWEQTGRIGAPGKKLLPGASVLPEQDDSQEQRSAGSRLKSPSILEEY